MRSSWSRFNWLILSDALKKPTWTFTNQNGRWIFSSKEMIRYEMQSILTRLGRLFKAFRRGSRRFLRRIGRFSPCRKLARRYDQHKTKQKKTIEKQISGDPAAKKRNAEKEPTPMALFLANSGHWPLTFYCDFFCRSTLDPTKGQGLDKKKEHKTREWSGILKKRLRSRLVADNRDAEPAKKKVVNW